MSSTKCIRALSFGQIAVAAILLINPMPMLFDCLPDCIAYALMIHAIYRVANIMPEFDEAKEYLSRMLMISAFKIPAFFVMLTIWGGDTSQRSIVSVFTLVFSIIECCYLLPTFHRLFSAFYRLGETHGCQAALTDGHGAWRMRPETLENLTCAFVIVRSLMSCLPELTLVSIGGIDDGAINWNTFYPICAILAAIVVLLMGITWCCYFIAYLWRMRADTATADALSLAYRKNPNAQGLCRYRRIRAVIVFYVIGICCSFDLIFDNVNYLPDILSAIGFFAAAVVLYLLLSRGRAACIACGVYAVSTIVYTALTTRFYSSYSLSSLGYDLKAKAAYRWILVASAVKQILLVAVIILLFLSLLRLIREETDRATPSIHRPMAELTRRELSKKMLISTVFACLTSLASYFYELTYTDLKQLAADPVYTSGFVTLPTLDWFWAVVWGFNILWLGYSIYAFSRLREEAELNVP